MYDGLINCRRFAVSIASGGTTSDAVDLEGYQLVGLETPSALTSTSVTFTAANVSGTYNPVYDDAGNVYTVTVSTSRYIILNPADLCGLRYVKVVAGSAEGAARTLYLIARPV